MAAHVAHLHQLPRMPTTLFPSDDIIMMDDDTDEKDSTKRKSRNLSEKKRRDQFNMLVHELSLLVGENKKLDKSSVLKATIAFLANHIDQTAKSKVHEIHTEWKPTFVTNEEFVHVTLEALDAFIIVFSTDGQIFYASEDVASLLNYIQGELLISTIFDITHEDDHSVLYNVLMNVVRTSDQDAESSDQKHEVAFTCHIRRGGSTSKSDAVYEMVHFTGYYRIDNNSPDMETDESQNTGGEEKKVETKIMFVCTGRLKTPDLVREMPLLERETIEFTSKHSLEWKFVYLDHRAPPIIGWLPFEVLGTSAYDYYHYDDLDKLIAHHESLLLKGEGTSGYYRFLTRGQQWIWLQSRVHISYNQWNSKPEFVMCTHRVISYIEVAKSLNRPTTLGASRQQQQQYSSDEPVMPTTTDGSCSSDHVMSTTKRHYPSSMSDSKSPSWSSKSSRTSKSVARSYRNSKHKAESDTTSLSSCSQSSRHFYPRRKLSSTNSSVSSRLLAQDAKDDGISSEDMNFPQPQEDYQFSQLKLEYCRDFIEPMQFSTLTMEPIPTTLAYADAGQPILAPIPAEIMQTQGLALAPLQMSQLSGDPQQKPEELQKIIQQQQEEIRKITEQLVMARCGIFPPMLNVGISYNSNEYQQPMQDQQDISGIGVFPIPIQVNTMPMELFNQQFPTNEMQVLPIGNPGNVVQVMGQLPGPIPGQNPHPQAQQIQSGDLNASDLMDFQLMQQGELIYTNMDAITTQQLQQHQHQQHQHQQHRQNQQR